MNIFDVRPSGPADVDALREHLATLATEGLPGLLPQRDPDDRTRRYLLVAWLGDRRVGFLDFRGMEAPEQRHVGRIWVSVSSEYRGRGAGTRLIEALLAWAPRADFERLEADVLENNPGAVRFLMRLGFETECLRTGAVRVAGAPVSVRTLVRWLPIPGSVEAQDRRSFEPTTLASLRLATIVESASDAIITTDTEGRVTSWNAGAERIFGVPASLRLGRKLDDLVPADRQHEAVGLMTSVLAGRNVQNFETYRIGAGGKLVPLWINASPIRDLDGRVVGCTRIGRDLTPLREREREIARLSRLYSALSQINQVLVRLPDHKQLLRRVCEILVEAGEFKLAWIGWYDPETQRLKPRGWAGAAETLAGSHVYADERPAGQGPTGLAFREGRPQICNDLLNDPIAGIWREQALRCGFRAAAAFPIREGDRVVGTLSVYEDTTGFFREREIGLLAEAARDISFGLDNWAREQERRRAEALAENERQFATAMIESMPGVIYLYDENFRFLRWNRNFEAVSGYTSQEFGALKPLDFFALDEKRPVAERIEEVFTRGESAVEAGLRLKDGRIIPYFFTGRRLTFDGRSCLVGMGIDISEQKRAQSALRELNETLEQKVVARTEELNAALVRAEAADRLKSAFLATMSHELRTPLNSIIGFTSILAQGLAGPLTAEQSKQLGMVKTSARHLLELINDVLDLSKIEAEQLEVHLADFDLATSVERVVELIRPQVIQRGLTLEVELAPDLGVLRSDRRRVEQILLNLLSNAVKFTETGGVRARASAPDPTRVAVQVTDTGMGIRPEHLATVFLPFRQLDIGLARTHEGTGLGLAICRRLAGLLGGEVSVESEWERGSTFTLTLPRGGRAR